MLLQWRFLLFMRLRILYWLGIAACVSLIISCFLPWGTFDVDGKKEVFTGFYSYDNYYGRPGKFLVGMATIALVMMLIPRLWAKQVNLFVCALTIGYAIYIYFLYSSCYLAYCPVKLPGIYMMLSSASLMLIACIFPEINAGLTRRR